MKDKLIMGKKIYMIRDWMAGNWFIAFLAFIGFIRYWMAVHTNYALVAGPFDDELGAKLGNAIYEGEWLGEYNMYTLIKGATYPFYLALLKWGGFTYGQGMGILIVSAALIMVKMLRKVIRNKYFLLGAYCYVLFLPIGYASWSGIHIYRDAILPWLLLILFSCLFAIYFDRKQPWKQSTGWILGVVITFPALCHLREDMIWLYPLIIVAFFLSAIGHYKVEKRILKCLCFIFIPWLTLFASNGMISLFNYQTYGLFEVNDRTHGSFSDMMSLMYKVEDDSVNEKIWCTYDMLQNCIQVSPTLQSMEESINDSYASWSEMLWDGGPVEGDFMQWVLREAFAESGYYTDAVTTEEMIDNVVKELETAYEYGTLTPDHKIHISSQGRGMRMDELLSFCGPTLVNIWRMPQYAGCQNFYPFYPTCDESLLEEYEKILSQPFSNFAIDELGGRWGAKIGQIFAKIYQRTGVGIFCISILGFVAMCICAIINRKKGREKDFDREGEILMVSTGIMLSGFLLIYMVTVFTSFLSENNFYNYTTGYYIILVLFEILMIYFLGKIIRRILLNELSKRGRKEN